MMAVSSSGRSTVRIIRPRNPRSTSSSSRSDIPNSSHFSALVPKDASVSELPEHIYLDWVLSDVIEEIIVSPYADVNYEDLVRHAINTTDASLAGRVALSVLHERRYPPGF
jgi:hypothetical protein